VFFNKKVVGMQEYVIATITWSDETIATHLIEP